MLTLFTNYKSIANSIALQNTGLNYSSVFAGMFCDLGTQITRVAQNVGAYCEWEKCG